MIASSQSHISISIISRGRQGMPGADQGSWARQMLHTPLHVKGSVVQARPNQRVCSPRHHSGAPAQAALCGVDAAGMPLWLLAQLTHRHRSSPPLVASTAALLAARRRCPAGCLLVVP